MAKLLMGDMRASERQAGPAIWIDVEDIFAYFRYNPHPSGVQRVAIALARALMAEPGRPAIRIARHGATPGTVREIGWADVETLLATPPEPEPPPPDHVEEPLAKRSRLERVVLRLPPELRDPLFRAGVLQGQSMRNVRALYHLVRPPPPRELRSPVATVPISADGPAPGDAYLVLGAPWSLRAAPAHLTALRERGVCIVLLIHDLIQVRRPEWQPRSRGRRFREWLAAALSHADLVLTISAFTAGDVRRYVAEQRLGFVGRLQPLPPGVSLPDPAPSRPVGLPVPGTYALVVGTLEARKNHVLAVKVWQKLMAEVRAGQRSAGSVPQLVFAGRIGIGVADLLQQMDNSRWLNGRIRLIRDPTDTEIRALYDGCLFTLMPSVYEGWGLPVRESLALGKPCLAARATALPEAGGGLCRYFDPEHVGDALRAVAAILDAPDALAAWQDDVRREFRPRDWRGAAQAILRELALVPA